MQNTITKLPPPLSRVLLYVRRSLPAKGKKKVAAASFIAKMPHVAAVASRTATACFAGPVINTFFDGFFLSYRSMSMFFLAGNDCLLCEHL